MLAARYTGYFRARLGMKLIVQSVVTQLALVSKFAVTTQTHDRGLAVVQLGVRKVRVAFLGGEEGVGGRIAPEATLDSTLYVEGHSFVFLNTQCTEYHSFRAWFADDSLRGAPRCDENPRFGFLFAHL